MLTDDRRSAIDPCPYHLQDSSAKKTAATEVLEIKDCFVYACCKTDFKKNKCYEFRHRIRVHSWPLLSLRRAHGGY